MKGELGQKAYTSRLAPLSTHSQTHHDVLPLNLRFLLGELLALEFEAETEGGRGQQIKTMQRKC